MLVARTCQLYPRAAAATIVHKLFMVFSQWPWPKPVLLRKIDDKLPDLGVFDFISDKITAIILMNLFLILIIQDFLCGIRREQSKIVIILCPSLLLHTLSKTVLSM